MKRKLVLTTLLFTSILMLAFAVVPHHHHAEGQVCMEQSHCECNHKSNTCDENNPVDHHHDNDEECFLKHQMAEPRKANETVQAAQNIIHPAAILPLTLLNVLFIEPVAENVSEIFIVNNFPLYNSLLYSSTGLRAPPTRS